MFAVGIALFGLLGLILDWYIAPQTSTQKKDLVQTLGLITAGGAGAVGIFFTWRGQRLAREAQEDNQKNTLVQLKNAQEQLNLTRQSQEDNQKNTQDQLEQARNELDITRQGQITGRFTQAIDQLGSDRLEIKLGGIYSLERTAHDGQDYHWPIMEVLATYVRTHASKPNNSREATEEVMDPPTSLEPDIQAVLTVIGRRSEHHRNVEYGAIDLHGTSLARANLAGANLPEANLSSANISGGVNLSEARLLEANLQGAILVRANFSEANLYRANLQEADLEGANLKNADLTGAILSRAIMPDGQKYEDWLKDKEARKENK